MNNKAKVLMHVKPFKVDNIHVYIKCPYCKETHVHGSCGGKDYKGFRSAHCISKPSFDLQYYIEEIEKEKNNNGS